MADSTTKPTETETRRSFLSEFNLDEYDDARVCEGSALLHEQDLEGIDIHPDLLWRYSDLVNNAVLQIASAQQRRRFRRIALRPYFRVIHAEAAALYECLAASGYSILPSQEEYHTSQKQACYYRFDIHHRDIAGAYGFVDYYLSKRIPATFFLEWGALNYSTQQKRDFVVLADTIEPPLRIGLHASPVDNYLCWSVCEGQFVKYISYMKSDEWLERAKRLAANDSEREAFHQSVLSHFGANVADFSKTFTTSIPYNASHGGILSQFFRSKLESLGEVGKLIESLWAENWITSERAQQVGLIGDVEQCLTRHGVLKLSDSGGRARVLARNVVHYSKSGRPIQILIHPLRWFGARREGRLTLLNDGKES